MDTVLIIEDDPAILLGLRKNLKFEGYEVIVAPDGETGLGLALERKPDLIILDVMLPRLNGFEITRTLKRNQVPVPIIILSAKDQEIDKIMGLDLGADDYMTKPFSVRELIARVHAVLRRKRAFDREHRTMEFGRVRIDVEARAVERDGEAIEMSPREFELLRYLAENPRRVLERRQILNRVWGFDYSGTARTIDNFVTKLRQKIEDDPDAPRHLLTVRGVGYKFEP